MEILAVENLSFKYPLTEKAAISGISFSVSEGEFIAICGATASGKSTLLCTLKRELAPKGEMSGSIRINGKNVSELPESFTACKIGYVMQRPEQQIVTDKVWHELAFGLENMNVPPHDISRRIAEMASYFGIGDWFDKSVNELSGGQKQLLNLASVMVMQPEILILDEPTAQLDPIAASDFISTLKKLNRDLSLTIIIAEHRLEEVIPQCDRLMVMDGGKLLTFGKPAEIISRISDNEKIMRFMPSAARIFAALGESGSSPVSIREGREFIRKYKNEIKSLPLEPKSAVREKALEFSDVYFRYERNGKDILCGADFSVECGEIFCILGGNGSGKSTMLSAAAGLIKPYSGKIKIFGKKISDYKNQSLYKECTALMPQDVQTLFLCNTVREELEEAGTDTDALPFDIKPILDKHPYDLSGGEQQLAALAKVLAAKPKLLLLDEPTKGLDAGMRKVVSDILKNLKESGVTVAAVTHDVEFAAMCADRCALFFRGETVSDGTPCEFFSGSSFYTTAASRITRGHYENAVTVEQAVRLCRMNGGAVC